VQTVYLGTSAFAAAVLAGLADTPHRPSLVVTRPDRPRGRGRKLQSPPIVDTARELGIEVFQPEDVNAPEAVDRIAAVQPDAVCVCAFGALIKEPLLSTHRMLNVHPSLLPRWRGAAPIERAIMAGDAETGMSIMQVTAGLDSGPVYLQQAVPIGPDDTFGTLAERLHPLGAELLARTIEEQPEPVEQDDEQATYAEKITREDRILDPTRPAVELYRVVRALEPHIGALLPLGDGTLLGVRGAEPVADGPPAGELAELDGRLVLGTGDGGLALTRVQPPGKKAMAAADYLRGHAIPAVG
jgi:methionyl-tRNA formyltransferase